MSVQVFPQPTAAGGFDFTTMTAQQTFNTSSNNVAVSGKNWVYALLAGGGGGGGSPQRSSTPGCTGGPGGGVAFGMVPVTSVVVIGSGGTGAAGGTGSNHVRGNSGGFSTYSGLRANGGYPPALTTNASTTFPGFAAQFNVNANGGNSLEAVPGIPGFAGAFGFPGQGDTPAMGAGTPFLYHALMGVAASPYVSGIPTTTNGGNGATGSGGSAQNTLTSGTPAYTGGNSMTGYTGGAAGTPNTTGNAAAGSGGGAGISGNGNAGASNNSGSTAGGGGSGGTGGGGGGAGGSASGIATGGNGGAGGAGALIIYY